MSGVIVPLGHQQGEHVKILGFYAPKAGQQVDTLNFLEANIKGLCGDLANGLVIHFEVFHKEDFEAALGGPQPVPIVYIPKEAEFQSTSTGEPRKQKRTFIVNNEGVTEMFGAIVDMSPRKSLMQKLQQAKQMALLVQLWFLVFRSVRQVVLTHVLSLDHRLPFSVLDDLKKAQPELSNVSESIQALVQHPELKESAELEADVQIITLLAAAQIGPEVMMNGADLNYPEIKRVLKLSKKTYDPKDLEVLGKK